MADYTSGSAALEEIVAGSVWRVISPMPIFLEPVNVYVLRADDGIVVVDTGIKSQKSLQGIEDGLRKLGADWRDVKHLVLTHCHVDHCGLTAGILEKCDPTVYGHPYTRQQASQAVQLYEPQEHPAYPFFRALGLPEEIAVKMFQIEDYMQRAMFEPGRVDVTIQGGDVLDLPPYRFAVLDTPGHCPGHIALHDTRSGLLLCGDILHKDRLPPCPLPIYPARPYALDEVVAHLPQDDYAVSLRVARDQGARLHLPGHGPAFRDIEPVLSGYVKRLSDRLGKVAELCRTPTDIYTMTRHIYGDSADYVTWLTASETLYNVAVLLRQGALRSVRGTPHCFESTRTGGLPEVWRGL